MNLKSKKERKEQILTPQKLANGRVLSLDAPQGLKPLEFVQQGLSLTPAKAFSLAEAMIVLLIGTIALGMSAPMISRQLKNETMNNVQFQVLNRKIERLEQQVRNSGIPKGTVAFFDNSVVAESVSNPCPAGWEKVQANWNGRFPRFSGEHTLITYVYDETVETLVDTGVGEKQNLSIGQTQEDAIREIDGEIVQVPHHQGTGVFRGIKSFNGGWGFVGGYQPWSYISFDASRVVPTDKENRPKSVALLGCRKL